MTAFATVPARAVDVRWEAHGGQFMPVALAVARRNLLSIRRAPSVFVSSLMFPIMSIITMSGAYSGVALVPGFPANSMAAWMLGFTVVQASAMVGMSSGLGLIRDIETKFYDRLLLAPINRGSLIGGLYLAVSARVVVPFAITLGLAMATGARFYSNPVLGILCVFVAAEGSALLGAGYGIGMGLRLRTFAAAPIMFMTVFVVMFLSPVQVPLGYISGWLHHIAVANPITRVTSLARAGLTHDVKIGDVVVGHGGITTRTLAEAVGVLVPSIILLAWFAVRGMRKLDN